MFDALLRMQLGPIIERLAEMEAQLEDLYRRADSFCRIGVCQEVDAAGNTCKVSHGELLSPAIRFFNPSAGAQSETRIPSVGGAMSVAQLWRWRGRCAVCSPLRPQQ
nr:hypothetical protein 3 [bacterium]